MTKFSHNFQVVFVLWNIIKAGIGDPVSDQLTTWALQHPGQPPFCTDSNGIPYPSLIATLAIGPDGPPLLQDRSLIERTTSFNRERIPERAAHALGFGAHGTFTVTHDVSRYTKAKFLNGVGKTTPIFLRFSGTIGDLGFPDTLRDSRGFAIKFYTEEGNFDMVGNQLEIFGVRDAILFHDMIRSRKRNAQTGLIDPMTSWDFNQLRPEVTHHLLKSFSDISTPGNLRMINGSGVHTFQLVNERNEAIFCKFHFISHQKFELMSNAQTIKLAGSDPSYYRRDLYNAIARKQYPRWTMALQVATAAQAESYRWDYLDITKNWRVEDFPLIPVGILELNRNVRDFYSESEQVAMSPANLVPGIEPSADRMLHARMFSYADAQRYRVGPNGNQLPINKPLNQVASYERDGPMCFGANGDGGPNYFPNSFNGPIINPAAKQKPFHVNGDVVRADTRDADNFSQAKLFVEKDLTPDARHRLVTNLAGSLKKITPELRELVYRHNFDPVSPSFGMEVRLAVQTALKTPDPVVQPRT
ncbi:unnamed protein product [Orchesella dallaii]